MMLKKIDTVKWPSLHSTSQINKWIQWYMAILKKKYFGMSPSYIREYIKASYLWEHVIFSLAVEQPISHYKTEAISIP